MAIGRTDEQGIPAVTQAHRRRHSVWGLFGETQLGQRSFVPHQVGRKHDRTRTTRQITQKALAPQGPSKHDRVESSGTCDSTPRSASTLRVNASALRQRQAEHQTQGRHQLDRKVGVAELPARRVALWRHSTHDHRLVQPRREVAEPVESGLMERPVR